jgi:hypothetical protein
MPKALGKDIQDFYDNHFPPGYYHDDNALKFHDEDKGDWILEADEKYDLDECGVLVPEASLDGIKQDYPIPFSTAFRKYMKARTTDTLVIHIPKEKREQVVKALADLGIKV